MLTPALRQYLNVSGNFIQILMNSTGKYILIVLHTIASTFTSCTSSTNKKIYRTSENDIAQNTKSAYALAEESLSQLQKNKVDTIIFCKRTCINCCDFFNIFWTAKDKKYLNKFYFDFDDMKTHSVSIILDNEKLFGELNRDYSILKSTAIKGNAHQRKDGRIAVSTIDHYCYSEINIFTKYDSIKSGRIEDHSFEKYTSTDQREKGQTNDSYTENIESKWNIFLIKIEEQLSGMSETKSREFETMRTQKISK